MELNNWLVIIPAGLIVQWVFVWRTLKSMGKPVYELGFYKTLILMLVGNVSLLSIMALGFLFDYLPDKLARFLDS